MERNRRTDDGTYPNAGEELAKIEERAGVTTKICRYSFSIFQNIVFGVAQPLLFTQAPSITLQKVDRVFTNAPESGILLLSSFWKAGKQTILWDSDAWAFSPRHNAQIDLPAGLRETIPAKTNIYFVGNYTGAIPHGFEKGQPYQLSVDLMGPADELEVYAEAEENGEIVKYRVRINRPDSTVGYIKDDGSEKDWIGSKVEADFLAATRNAHHGARGLRYTVEPYSVLYGESR